MSDVHEPEPDDDQDNQPVGIPRRDLKALREKARKADEAERRAQAAERHLAFVQAGIPSDGLAKYFVKGYDGELSPDAIRSAWDEANGGQHSGDQVTVEEQAAYDRIANAQAGANNQQPASREAEFHARMASAKTQAELEAVVEDARRAGVMV